MVGTDALLNVIGLEWISVFQGMPDVEMEMKDSHALSSNLTVATDLITPDAPVDVLESGEYSINPLEERGVELVAALNDL